MSKSWLWPAMAVVGAMTTLRLVLLWFNETDLFVDEAQYWLWGQEFAFGYYSKPPLIAWVIGAVTWIAGSDAPFWVRAPGAVLHGVTALVLGAWGNLLLGQRAGVWVAAAYVTLPLVAVGSLLFSTDTVMAPLFAGALYAHARLVKGGHWRWAVVAGALAGLAFLAKYAAAYFLLGVGLGALVVPALRIGWGHAALLLAAFCVVIAPNIAWNVNNGMMTALHTLDNARALDAAVPWSMGRLAEFFASQFAVFGPVFFAALIAAAIRVRSGYLWVFIWPAIVLICWQALTKGAYANWAVSAYFAGTVVVVSVMLARPALLWLGIAVNAAICVALPALTVVPQAVILDDGPILARYLGREALSEAIIAEAKAQGGVPIVSERRDVLADLFYTGRDAGMKVFAPRPAGRPANHYEQRYALPEGISGQVLLITHKAPQCPAEVVLRPDLAGGAYAGDNLLGYLVDADCFDANP